MDRLAGIEAFVRVVENGSFVRAAERLALSTLALSQRVADLEAHLGTRLLNRTTRKLSLTESGQAFFERGVPLLADLEEAEQLASSSAASPRGRLKLTCAHAIGVQRLAPAIARFHLRHLELKFDVMTSDRIVDLVEEGFDLAIRIGVVGSDQLVARKLGTMHVVMCASPAYLKRRGTPRSAADLAQHDLLTYAYARTPRLWTPRGPDGARVEVKAGGSLHANSGEVLVAAAVAGQAIILETDFHGAGALAVGRLVRVLPQYEGGGGDIWAVYRAGGTYRPRCGCSSTLWRRCSPPGRTRPGRRRLDRPAARVPDLEGEGGLSPFHPGGETALPAGGWRLHGSAAHEPARRTGYYPGMTDLDEQIRRAVEPLPGIDVLVLFGSRAAGRPRADSDLDVAVLPATDDPRGRRRVLGEVAVALAELAPLGRVDVVLLDEAPALLRQRIMEGGRLLLCRAPGRWRAWRLRTMREYGDMEPARRLFREALHRRLAG